MAYEINCLDLGTTKVTLLSAEISESGTVLKGVVSLPSRGLRKGQIVDMEEAALSIKKSVKEAQKRFNVKIDSVTTGISGNLIEIFESYGAVRVRGKRISERDIENAIESASSVYIPLDRELLHVIPVEFIVDNETGIRNPIGMKGFRLAVRVQIITAPVKSVENLIGVCEQAGLKVENIVFEPLALRKALLTEEEIEEGVLLLDIGGGTTDIAIFKDRRLIHTASIPVGGNHITNDLAIGLKISVKEAEVVKIKYSSAIMRDSLEEIEIDSSRTKRRVPLRLIDEIIYARTLEVISMIKAAVEKAGEKTDAYGICGAVLTGGSSLLNGLDILFESLTGMPVRIGYPDRLKISGLSSSFLSPQNTLAFGLLSINAERIREYYKDRFLIKGIIERIKKSLRMQVFPDFRLKKYLTSEF